MYHNFRFFCLIIVALLAHTATYAQKNDKPKVKVDNSLQEHLAKLYKEDQERKAKRATDAQNELRKKMQKWEDDNDYIDNDSKYRMNIDFKDVNIAILDKYNSAVRKWSVSNRFGIPFGNEAWKGGTKILKYDTLEVSPSYNQKGTQLYSGYVEFKEYTTVYDKNIEISFLGHFRDGLANGNGAFYINDNTDYYNPNRLFRKGEWYKGKFNDEDEAEKMVINYLKDKSGFNKIKFELIGIISDKSRDIITGKFSRFLIRFKVFYILNDGKIKEEYMQLYQKDIFSPLEESKSDQNTFINPFDIKEKSSNNFPSFNDLAKKSMNSINEAAKSGFADYFFDDLNAYRLHLKQDKTTTCSESAASYRSRTEEQSRTGVYQPPPVITEYSGTKHYNLEFITRKTRKDQWEVKSNLNVVSSKKCSDSFLGTNGYFIEGNYDRNYISFEAIVRDKLASHFQEDHEMKEMERMQEAKADQLIKQKQNALEQKIVDYFKKEGLGTEPLRDKLYGLYKTEYNELIMLAPTNYYFYLDLDKCFDVDAYIGSFTPFEFKFKNISANEYELFGPSKETIKFNGNKVEFTFENGKSIKGVRL